MLCKWRSAYNADKEGCFPGKGNIKASDREIYELRKELSDVKQEREILKKPWSFSQRLTRKIHFYKR